MRRDLTRQRFGKLVVVSPDGLTVQPSGQKKSKSLCRCDCGNMKSVLDCNLTKKKNPTESCGCIMQELYATGGANLKHGHSKPHAWTSEYGTWAGMIQRCTNPNNERWEEYGGRGITVFERWMKFENFLADMGRKPSPELQIERKDNNGNYEPSNCKWATRREQSLNKRSSRVIQVDERSQTLTEWAEESGLQHQTISVRIKRGWSAKDAVTLPPSNRRYKNIKS